MQRWKIRICWESSKAVWQRLTNGEVLSVSRSICISSGCMTCIHMRTSCAPNVDCRIPWRGHSRVVYRIAVFIMYSIQHAVKPYKYNRDLPARGRAHAPVAISSLICAIALAGFKPLGHVLRAKYQFPHQHLCVISQLTDCS